MSFFTNFVESINSVVDSVVENAKPVPNTVLRVNGQTYRITRLLGEGGFSIVYLAQDDTKKLYAIKSIRCKMGKEMVDNALREVVMTDRFQHENIIKIVDMCLVKEEDGSKTMYIIMPFYKSGNLQDLIDRNNAQGKSLPENQMLSLFKRICLSVQAVANYKNRAGVCIPWAHRDIKPANILFADDGKTPILMDFGSARPARVEIHDRKSAMKQQDDAAENCSMPYRAPELFDVKLDTLLDERVDVWSLGCTLFAMAYGESPFEMTINQQGGTMALAVLNRQFYIPASKKDLYSKKFQDLISWILTSDPKSRPTIDALIKAIDRLQHST